MVVTLTATLRASAIVLSLLVSPAAPEAQQPGSAPRVAFLSPNRAGSASDDFVAGLRALGYVEGRTIVIERRFAEGRYEKLPELAAELVRQKVDVLVVTGTPAAAAAKRATSTIPIVMAAVGNPVGNGFVASLARPGGNITGTTTQSPETRVKSLQLLRETIPRVSRVAYLWNPANPANALGSQESRWAAQSLGLVLQFVEVSHPSQLDSAFASLTKTRPDALIMTGDPMLQFHVGRVVDFAVTHRLPAMYPRREHVNEGGLMSYGVSYADLYRRAAVYVDKILKGAKPAELPVEQPTKFELAINMKTAKTLGLSIPQAVLLRADQIID